MPDRGEMPARRPRMPQDETRGAGPIERPTRRRKSERADQTGARSGGAETRPLCRLGYTLCGRAPVTAAVLLSSVRSAGRFVEPGREMAAMTEADFSTIEGLLGRPLPVWYRRVMTRYPLDPSDSNSAIALLDDVRSVVGINRELREGEFADEWRSEWLAIGNSPSGDMYFLDLSGASIAVFMWDHETHEVVQEALDLDSFVRQRRRDESGGEPA